MPMTIEAILILYSTCSWYDVITATSGAVVPQIAYRESFNGVGMVIGPQL